MRKCLRERTTDQVKTVCVFISYFSELFSNEIETIDFVEFVHGLRLWAACAMLKIGYMLHLFSWETFNPCFSLFFHD